MEEEYEEYYVKGEEESEENPVYGAAVCTNSLGLGPLLVQIWRPTEPQLDQGRGCKYTKLKTKQFRIIGCDKEEDRSQLLRYRSHFADSTIRFHEEDNPKGVIERVFKTRRPEMSPNISYYSEAEYPHQKFALSCSILASFCFPFFDDYYGYYYDRRVMEIVSTRDQPIGALRNFCKSFFEERYSLYFDRFRELSHIKDYKNEELNEWLVEECRDLRLPFAQYWVDVDHFDFKMGGQFSSGYRDRKNLPPWCQLRDALKFINLCPLAKSSRKASFCSDITLVSITEYPLAHYAKNYGPLACFSILLFTPDDLTHTALEFFFPDKLDNSSHQTLMSKIWARLKKRFPSYLLSENEEIRGQVLEVTVINSSCYNQTGSFKIGQHDSSLNSNSSEEGTTGEMPSSIQNEASQLGNTLADERDEPVEALSNMDVGCATSNVGIRNVITTASQPSRIQTKTMLCQQVAGETLVLQDKGNASQQLPCLLQPLSEDSTQQNEQVVEIIRESTPNTNLNQKNSTVDVSEESPIKCIEPQSLTSQLRRSEEIFRDEGYTMTSERDSLVEGSSDEYGVPPPASKRLKKSKIPCTKENIRKHFGKPLKDAADIFGVSISTFKRRCRDGGISWWQPGKRKIIIDDEPGRINLSSVMPNLPKRAVATHANQDFNTMTVKVTLKTDTIRFELPCSSGIAELENSVIERLSLDRKSFSLKYQDEEGDWVLIACDKDVHECIKISRSLSKTIIKMVLGPPINSFLP